MTDIDPIETQEWLAALTDVKKHDGQERVDFLLKKLGVSDTVELNTPYINTIPVASQPQYPGDQELERSIRAGIRWNAAAMVVRASQKDLELGGHIGTYASAATLIEVGFNHFWSAPTESSGGDLIFFQGHASPGIYARSFLEGRLSEKQLDNFRQEAAGRGTGLSSYPHPWLMPDYWQFPTVSMGLGPLQAIYQARIAKYLLARDVIKDSSQKVWCFCGDGEMDEPESLGALSIANREKLDNLIFVVNCNLQRLDGPVRGDGKIIQELEAIFHGNGWNVIKVIWGSNWDPLLAKDKTGMLKQRMLEVVDGEYQNYATDTDGAYIREHFFGKYPELLELVADMSDEDLTRLQRGGHDPEKIYAAYNAAVKHTGGPTVILAQTVKGYGLGSAGEGLNTAHNTKKMNEEQLKAFRDRFHIPVPDRGIAKAPYLKFAPNSPEKKYLQQRRDALKGFVPQRREKTDENFIAPELKVFDALLKSSGDRTFSSTTAFVRILSQLCKDKTFGSRIVPIIPDEARTFGMEGLFRQLGIYAPSGQLYTPVDSGQVMYYKEAKDGQLLEEGINEAGAFSSWLACATSYSVHNKAMLPFYTFYSMFGFQRVGDLLWAAGDSRARGFVMGGTAGRTTLNGEGLQHEDGQSQIMASFIPNCISYDPTFSYELAVIIQDGVKRMLQEQEDVFYYITLMNENYPHPEMPKDVEDGILRGMYRLQGPSISSELQVQLLGSGTILLEVIAAAKLLQDDFKVSASVWSATSFNLLARDGHSAERWNMLHPLEKPKVPYVTKCLLQTKAPVIAATDYMRAFADQIRQFVPHSYTVLGTDGFGRSDSRANLRSFFAVDRYNIVVAALKSLADQQKIKPEVVQQAIVNYKLNPDNVMPGMR